MDAIRITQKLESEMLYLPQLRSWVGRNVEIIVREAPPILPEAPVVADPAKKWVSPLAGTVLRDDDPFGPAVPPEDWEANR